MSEPRVLLVGPYPPPHGGISVHVAALARRLRHAGATCRVLNLDPRAEPGPECLTLRGGRDLVRIAGQHARDGFAVHLHTNGHGLKSWLIVLACGAAARGGRAFVTLHSGLLAAYVHGGNLLRRALVRRACAPYSRIVCVNPEIRDALAAVGVPEARLLVRPAFLAPAPSTLPLPADLEAWLLHHSPVLSSTVFFRPEYGLEVLLDALVRLRAEHARIGCVVMGGGDREAAAALVRSRGLEGAVRLLGDIDHALCLEVMARSDVFVRASLADGDSISVREALALGVRTVASDVGRRPPGIVRFPAGDADALAAAVERARTSPPPDGAAAEEDAWKELSGLYQPPALANQGNEAGFFDAPTILRG